MRMRRKYNSNPLKEAYKEYRKILMTLDRSLRKLLQEKFENYTCRKGCSYCCSQLVLMRRIETSYLAYNISRCRGEIRKIIKDQLLIWHERFATFCSENNLVTLTNLESEKIRREYFKIDNKCPLLERRENICLLYHARPVACRLEYVKTPTEFCKPSCSAEKVLRLNMAPIREVIDPVLSDLEKQYDMLTDDGKIIYDTFEQIYKWAFVYGYKIFEGRWL